MTEPRDVIGLALGTASALADGWQKEAERRRTISRHDPVADTLEHCSGELAGRIKELSDATAMLTVEEYAQLAGKSPQTVRAWIREGTLSAIPTKDGHRIRRDAVRVRRTA